MIDPAVQEIRQAYKDETQRIFSAHRDGASGFSTASRLTSLTDRTFSSLWDAVTSDAKHLAAVIALGGYGRYELCPHSDFDLMIVFKDEDAKREGSDAAQEFLHFLWDTGFDIGHSVRTISDCIRLYQTDVDVWASVLEGRYVCGSWSVLEHYTDWMLDAVGRGRDLKFIASVLSGITERHAKYGNSVRLLEPNLKNSAGGLRDLHSLLWIYRATDIEYFGTTPFQSNTSACREMCAIFERSGLISRDEMLEAVAALEFLLRIRHEMHYGSAAVHDNLEFSAQRGIARHLGYATNESEGELAGVERFMREYFLHARTLYRLNARLTHVFRRGTETLRRSSAPKEVILDDFYLLRDDTVWLRNTAMEFTTPAEILSAFYWAAVHSASVDPALLTRIGKAARSGLIFSPERCAGEATCARLRDILALRKNAASALRALSDADVLGAIIPHWARLAAYVQHSMYHYYTADAHTLLAIERAEALEGHMGLLGEVFRSLPRRDILYYALLFHDIEKPSGISGHDVRGAETARDVLQKLGVDDPHEDVPFLIRHHLAMEQTAFRRNFHAPETLEEFARLFARKEQLDMLYVLTCCDLSAVNKNVWSSWKESMLEELYARTRSLLRRSGRAETTPTQDMREALVKSLAPLFGMERVRAHFDSFDNEAYVHAFTATEIEQHLRALEAPAVPEGEAGSGPVSISIESKSSYSSVTVILKDRPFLLSALCGVLSANDANIIDAHCFTRADGTVIDRFRTVDGRTKSALSTAQAEKIGADIRSVLEGSESLETLFEKHRRRWKRRPKPLLHPNIRIDVRFHDAERLTIIDVYGPEMTGFLYKVTQVLSKLGLVIHFAKIGTRGDGIVDSFYVADAEGRPLTDDAQKVRIREKIVHTIGQLITVQLAQ